MSTNENARWRNILRPMKFQKTMNVVGRTEKAEKMLEKIVGKRRLITKRARLKGDSELIKRVEEEAELGGEVVGKEENALGTFEIEKYPVNEPYAYILIDNTAPPTYRVSEVRLTRGEAELLKEIKSTLYETMDVNFTSVTNPEEFLMKKVEEIIKDFSIELSPESKDRIMYYIRRDFIGYGPLDPILRDKMVEDISADGPGIPLYVYHRNYGSIRTNIVFDEEELDSLIYKLSQRAGRHISMAKPLLDASLPTKDRLQLSIGNEVTTRGSTFTIRKFREIPLTPIDLINFGTYSVDMMAYLWMAVENGSNILISGGTAAGKTTVLNAIAMFIPPESKIVSIEDTKEINLMHQNWIPSLTREREEGGHSIEMFDLLKAALRQRPEYILVGEVRGREAYTLFQAMATGHITFSTLHADSAEAVVKRLTKPPIEVPLMLLDSLDIITLQRMVKIGHKRTRRCVKIIEVTGVDFENDTLRTNELFSWKPDVFEFRRESSVFVEIMEKLNMDEEELADEFARRIKVLEWMRKKNINEFETISKFIFDYNINREEVMKMIEEGEGTN